MIARTTLPAGIPASLNWYVAAADDIAPLYSRWFVRGHAENFSPLSPEPQTRYSFDVSSYEFAGTDTVIAPSLRESASAGSSANALDPATMHITAAAAHLAAEDARIHRAVVPAIVVKFIIIFLLSDL
jgi:hypothetical protein